MRTPSAIILILLLLPTSMVQAAATATLSRTQLYAGESFDLRIKLSGGESAEPDLSPLAANFAVLGNQRSQVINIAGGQRSQESTWTITLIPNRAGTLVVPAIKVGKFSTSPLQVLVQEAPAGQAQSAAQDVFLEVTAEPEQPYVQQHVLYTIKLFRAITVNNATVDDPKAQANILRVEKLNDSNYTKQIQGRNYTVNELRYVLIPLQSGSIEVPASGFRGQTRTADRGVVSVARRADAITLNVRPIPAAFPTGANWLPAKGVSLRGGWAGNVQKSEVGTPLTYGISLRTENYLAHQVSLPPLTAPQGFRSYGEPPSLSNQADNKRFIGQYSRNTALIPEQPGNYAIPEILVPWWNTETDSLEYAKIPEAGVEIIAAASPPATAPTAQQQAPAQPPSATPTPKPKAESPPPAKFSWWWLLPSAIFLIAWLVTAFMLYRERQGRELKLSLLRRQHRESFANIKRDLQSACLQGESPKVRQLLLRWGQLQFPEDKPGNIRELAQKVPELRQPLSIMNKCLYHKRAQQWRGTELWQVVSKIPEPPPPKKSELEPLHRV